MASLWDYYSDIEKFDTLTDDKKDEIIGAFSKKDTALTYNYVWMLPDLLDKVNAKVSLKLIKFFFEQSRHIDSDFLYKIINSACIHKSNISKIKDFIVETKVKKAKRALLMFDGITKEEEEEALRSLSKVKYTPEFVYIQKYKPSKEAISSLPPVMRLNVIETLTNYGHIAYNIFERLGSADEFKGLFFGTAFKHNDRVAKVVDKYINIVGLGNKDTVKIQSVCNNCGEFEISITSNCIKTETALLNSKLGPRIYNDHYCPLCGKYNESGEPNKFIGPEECKENM